MAVAQLRERHAHDAVVGEREPHVARGTLKRAAELHPFDRVARVREALDDRVARELEHLRRRQRLAEKERRGLGQLMCFVEDDRVRTRQQLGHPGIAQHDVREEQVMIDDDDVRLLRLAARLHHEAVLVMRAFLAEAVVAGRRDHRPHGRRLRHARELGLVAALRELREADDVLQVRGVLPRRQAAVVGRALQIVMAQVVRAALEHRDRHGHRERVAHRRDVALEQLILQVLRARRHDHLATPEHRRDEIRVGLAGAGAGLDDQRVAAVVGSFVAGRRGGRSVAAGGRAVLQAPRGTLARLEDLGLGHQLARRFHCGGDGARHVDLRRARTIAVERAREQAAVAENGVELVDAFHARRVRSGRRPGVGRA